MRRAIFALILVGILIIGCRAEQMPAQGVPEAGKAAETSPATRVREPPDRERRVTPTDQQQLNEIELMHQAITKGDTAMCQQLTGFRVQGCLDRIAKVKAIRSREISVCEQIESSQIRYECKKGVRSA